MCLHSFLSASQTELEKCSSRILQYLTASPTLFGSWSLNKRDFESISAVFSGRPFAIVSSSWWIDQIDEGGVKKIFWPSVLQGSDSIVNWRQCPLPYDIQHLSLRTVSQFLNAKYFKNQPLSSSFAIHLSGLRTRIVFDPDLPRPLLLPFPLSLSPLPRPCRPLLLPRHPHLLPQARHRHPHSLRPYLLPHPSPARRGLAVRRLKEMSNRIN